MKSTEKRIKKIDARFTEEEYKLVLEMEKTLGIRKSDLVRNGLLKDKALVINAKELIAGLDKVGAELGRSGNNINQLAKYGNILQLKEVLSAEVAERFNELLEQYLGRQKELDVVLRKIIRTML